MKLGRLCEGLAVRGVSGGDDGEVEVGSLAYDSRAVEPGALFFCVSGLSSDGHDHAPAAIAAGAVALVVERPLGLGAPEVLVDDARASMAPLAARFYEDPSASLALAAVTGTNGKTTTAFLLRSIVERQGVGCGLLGTIKQVIGGHEVEAVRTTPEAIDLQGTFARMLEAGDAACSMEVSSHALVLGRFDCAHVCAAAFTNLTQDHLDFHADMEDYFAAKRLLFTGVEGRRRPPRHSVINVDDPYGRRLVAEIEGLDTGLISYSPSGRPATLSAADVGGDGAGSWFTLVVAGSSDDDARRLPVRLPLPGAFNVENALAALGLALGLGVGLEAAVAALAEVEPVPGRMEPISEGQPFSVLVDYAHTPDSLQSVLAAARGLTPGRLISVIGCGGDRDRAKRPLMGRAAAQLSDLVIVTSDNPRSESPAAIIDEILAGIEGSEGLEASGRLAVEVDRRLAIGLALRDARAGDMVVIAGKGHEQGQEFADGNKLPFDDRQVARDELGTIDATA